MLDHRGWWLEGGRGLEEIAERKCGLGEAEVVLALVGADGAAVGTGIDLVVEVEPSGAEGALEVPVLGDGPVVAVGEAESGTPPLLALVVGGEEFDVGDVVVA